MSWDKMEKRTALGRCFLCVTYKLSMFLFFPFATHWLGGPRDLLRNQGKKNTRFCMILQRVEPYSAKNTCWKKFSVVQKF